MCTEKSCFDNMGYILFEYCLKKFVLYVTTEPLKFQALTNLKKYYEISS